MTGRFFSVKPLESQLRPGQKVLRSAEYEQLLDYGQFTSTLEERLKQREQALLVEHEQAIRNGHAQGLEQANQEAATQLVQFSHALEGYLNRLEPQLVDVVIQAVRKIIHSYDDEERARQAVISGLEMIRGANKLIIRVNPQVHSLVASMIETIPHRFSSLEVVPEAQLDVDDCLLESDIGIVNSGLKMQLAAVEAAIRQGAS